MTTIQRETYWDCHEGVERLLEAHWKEVALYKGEVALEPDLGRYQVMEAQNRLVIVTAREGGEVVGYSIFLLHHHLHYKSCLVASNDVIYLRPDKRGIVGAKLIKRSEAILKSLGVKRMTWHVKPKHDWSAILYRSGYVQEEIIMGKLLGD
jgi:hypothetical protein